MIYLFSTLNFYFCRIFLAWLGSCALVIGAVISLFEGTELVRRFMGKADIDFSVIMEMILLKLPNHFQMLMPFIALAAAMATFYRINNTQEIVAARSSGLSIWQLAGGLSTFVFLLGVIQLIVLNPFSAAMTSRSANIESLYFSGSGNRMAISETGLWFREMTPERQSIIRALHIQLDTRNFAKVTFHNFSPATGSYETRIDASLAVLQKGQWELRDAMVWGDKENGPAFYPILKISTPLTIEKIQDSNTSPETISFWALPKFIEVLDKAGLSSLSYRLYWHGQVAKIGMMMAMALLAAGFGIRPIRQGGTTLYISFGIGSGFILYFINDIVYAFGLGGQIPLLLAAWTPTLVMFLLSLTRLLYLEDV